MTTESEQQRVLNKLRAMEKEKAPSMVLDKCDAKILTDYIESLLAPHVQYMSC